MNQSKMQVQSPMAIVQLKNQLQSSDKQDKPRNVLQPDEQIIQLEDIPWQSTNFYIFVALFYMITFVSLVITFVGLI